MCSASVVVKKSTGFWGEWVGNVSYNCHLWRQRLFLFKMLEVVCLLSHDAFDLTFVCRIKKPLIKTEDELQCLISNMHQNSGMNKLYVHHKLKQLERLQKVLFNGFEKH